VPLKALNSICSHFLVRGTKVALASPVSDGDATRRVVWSFYAQTRLK
jgi:hypothetical protein